MAGIKGDTGRLVNVPLHVLDLCLAAVVLGLAGWMVDQRSISSGLAGPYLGFGGNAATPWLATFSLVAGMVTIASIITALHHIRVWTPSSGAAAQATSWMAWLLLILPFCLAWKEIRLGGRAARYKVLEAFVIMLTITKFFSTLALYLAEKPRDTSSSTLAGKYETGAPGAAPAV